MYIVAVHGGAGFHQHSQDSHVKNAMRRSCLAALETLQTGGSACSAVCEAVVVLEDDSALNAGKGSNLTMDGTVECDASIMDGLDEAFGSVAAVSGVKNPVKVAALLLEDSRKDGQLGLVPPLTLASNGAHSYATRSGISTLPPEDLVTERAIKDWQTWKWRLDQLPDETLQDTVGAIALDSHDIVAAGVSSGGILLKLPGRIGEAAVYGAGCWASSPTEQTIGVACSVSGEGEQIIRAALARTICQKILQRTDEADEILQQVLTREVHGSEPKIGLIILVKEENGSGGYRAAVVRIHHIKYGNRLCIIQQYSAQDNDHPTSPQPARWTRAIPNLPTIGWSVARLNAFLVDLACSHTHHHLRS